MNHKLVHEQISNLLQSLNEHYERIKSSDEKMAMIDVDIMLNTTRQLYESLLSLHKIKHPQFIPETKTINQEITPETIETNIETVQSKEQLTETSVLALKNEEAIIVVEPVHKEVAATAIEQKTIEQRANALSRNAKPTTRNGNLFEETVVMADKFEEQTTVHDKFSKSKEDKSVHEKIQSQPLQDLKKSIGINEKFKFMNELFDGNLKEYNESIDFLNNCKTLEEAENFMQQTLSSKYNWKKESGVYQSLVFLIQRKFNF